MILRDLLQLVLFIGLLAALSPLLGRYVHQVFSGRRTFLHPVLGPVERGVYSLSGIHPDENQTWSRYAVSLIGFSLAGFLLTFGVLLFQDKLPLNPQGFPGLSWDLALNTAVSFLTNTNWQSYGGETTMSHFSHNMAGRGTDIKLDEISRELGGLKIIGTERHESRRIDNQLRGRAGRQGDPGESRFYLSLEDDLMRLFGSERLMNMFNAMGVPENEQIEHKMLSKAIEKAQMKIETNNYGIRENLLKYDEVMNEQREAIYAERRRVLDGENMRSVIMKMITDIVENAVDMSISDEQEPAEWDLSELNSLLLPVIPLEPIQLTEDQQHMKKNELKHMLKEAATKLYETREAEFTSAEQVREMERVIQGPDLPAVHVLLGRALGALLFPALSAAAKARRLVRGTSAVLVHRGRLLRHFPDRLCCLAPPRYSPAQARRRV